MWKAEVSLKATPLPPASLDPLPLRVVPAPGIVHRSPAPLGLLSAPFSVSIRWLLSGPRHVVSTRTQISPRRARGTRRTFRSCAQQPPCPPRGGRNWGSGVAGAGRGEAAVLRWVSVRPRGLAAPLDGAWRLLVLLSLAFEDFSPVAFLHPLL